MMTFDETDRLFDQKLQSMNKSSNAFLSILGGPLPSSEAQLPSRSHRNPVKQESPSFNEPFGDPDMEPLPLGPPKSRETIKPELYGLLLSNPFDGSSTVESEIGRYDNIFSPDSPLLQLLRQQDTSQATSNDTAMRFRPYQEKQWRGMYRKLVMYKHKNGHCCVPHAYKEDPMLARWVKRQRYQRKKFEDNDPTSTMTPQRLKDLESIGFVWQSHASVWQTKLNELRSFKHQTGHCNVPSDYAENPALATWVRSQRKQYQLWVSGCQCTMTVQRHEQLASVGFCFEQSD